MVFTLTLGDGKVIIQAMPLHLHFFGLAKELPPPHISRR